MFRKILLGAVVVAALCLATARPALAETVRDLVSLHNAPPIRVQGFGIVTGLANTGDKAEAARTMLQKYLSGIGMDFNRADLALGSVAFVQVTAELPAFFRPGQSFPVQVSVLNDAKSLAGGRLMQCELSKGGFSVDPLKDVMAVASGPIQTGTGTLTTGVVAAGQNSGAFSISTYEYGNVMNSEGWIRLNLITPNWGDASNIAKQINQTPSLNPNLEEQTMFAEAGETRPVAFAKDAGQVIVIVPERYRYKPTEYLYGILDVRVALDQPAKIVVNRSRNAIVVTGDIVVNNATVSIQDKTVTIRPETPEEPAAYTLADDTPRNLVEIDGPGTYADLQSLIDTLNAMGLSTEQMITIFEQLRTAKAITAELVIE